MITDLGVVLPGSTVRIPFSTFAGATGAPITMTNYVAGDVQIYKDGGTTQRASSVGITATTDFDSQTGMHLVTIDLADNTTADFYAAGSEYLVAVADVTVDSQTVRTWLARFRIGYRDAMLDTTIATLASQTSFTLTVGPADNNALVGCVAIIHDAASAVQMAMGVVSAYTGSTKTVTLLADPAIFTMAAKDNISFFFPANARWFGTTAQTGRDLGASVLLSSGTGTGQISLTSGLVTLAGVTHTNAVIPTVTTVTNLTNAPTSGDFTATMKTSITTACTASTPTAAAVTGNVGGNVVGSVGSVATGGITAGSFAAGAIDAAAIANGAIDAATFAADVDAEILSYLVDDATRIDASALNTASGTSIPAILVDTGTDGVVVAAGSKTGYTLTQSFPGNFASLSIDASGNVKVQGVIKKNTAVTAFPFGMTDNTNHAPSAGLTVTATRSIDGAAFASCANSPAEISNGAYKIDLAAGDVNGSTVILRFTAAAADDTFIVLYPVP